MSQLNHITIVVCAPVRTISGPNNAKLPRFFKDEAHTGGSEGDCAAFAARRCPVDKSAVSPCRNKIVCVFNKCKTRDSSMPRAHNNLPGWRVRPPKFNSVVRPVGSEYPLRRREFEMCSILQIRRQ